MKRAASLGRPLGGALLLAGSMVLAAGCVSRPAPHMLSDEAVLLDVPVTTQDEADLCGLASIAALCSYHRVTILRVQRDELTARAAEHGGLSGGELREALERLGFEVFVFGGSLDHGETGLYHHIDAARPLIVMTSAGGDLRHYVLFLGYDEPNGNVCLLDPERGQVLEPRQTFERSWKRCRRFTLLALPSELPTTNQEMLP